MTRYIQDKDRPTEIFVRNFTGDGSTVNFTVTQNQTQDKLVVTLNGIVQKPQTDYSVQNTGSSYSVLFASAPTATDAIQIKEMPI
jgi:hypothetical protein